MKWAETWRKPGNRSFFGVHGWKAAAALSLSMVFALSLCAPVWAGEVLLSQAGFAYWLTEKLSPKERRVSDLESRAQVLEFTLTSWGNAHLHRIYLWLDNTTVEYYEPGGVPAGNASLDVPPRIVDGRTMAPLRFVGEALGAEVDWDGETRQVAYTAGGRRILLTVGQKTAMIGDRMVEMDIPPMIINDRTMVPVRFVSQWLGAAVRWDESLRRVELSYYRDGSAGFTQGQADGNGALG
ncbi:MAG: copper amine oxidase N-terminal domain-containing protein [Clostridiales bacterium]|nr:copper amine oxidase N-terminal domain-containing protein [Clostridiales bacterium]